MTARKSTGGGSRAQPGDKCRNVAKRSTGPDAKCWAETRISAPYSYYRVDQPTVDPRQVKTKMAMGGMEITLDVEKMGQLVNLNCNLVLKDVAKESMDREELDL